MFRSLASARSAESADVIRVVDFVRAAGVVTGLVTVSVVWWRPWNEGARGAVLAVLLAASAAGWVAWLFTRQRPTARTIALIVMGAAGGAVTGISPRSAAVGVGCLVAFSAGDFLRLDISIGITAETVASFLAAGLITSAPPGFLLGYPFAFTALWLLDMTRQAYRVRAEQAEQTLIQTRRARDAETEAAALAERARIAREIHDVLAHSLAAVSVNLQAAEGLLSSTGDSDLEKAVECLTRAGTLTREGLAAARKAVLALRDDTTPLPGQLSSLADQYRAVGDVAVELTVSGEPRQLPAEASLTAYRTAQEALTNARKHAPGQSVRLSLGFEPAQVTVTVSNPLPAGVTGSRLTATGAGYGLAGLRERAALAGGTFEAGIDGESWQVRLRVPA